MDIGETHRVRCRPDQWLHNFVPALEVIAPMELDQSPAHVTCDGCRTQQAPLQKLSLGKDFFGRAYDRLSPSTDASPKWYCATCSIHKNLQRDFRDIQAELVKWTTGEPSQMQDPGHLQRARLRLREISLLLEQAGGCSPFLDRATVMSVMSELEMRTDGQRGRDARPV